MLFEQSSCLSVNEEGHLSIGSMDTLALAKKYGTPLYVLDEATVRAACRSYQRSIQNYYNGHGRAYYASKALCCKEMCRIIASEGLGLDVVSGGELYTARSVQFPAERICFHGNNKTEAELRYALESGVGRIVVDHLDELLCLDALAGEIKGEGFRQEISFRIKPGIDAHTHHFVRTGQIDSKFGVALETGEAMEIIRRALSLTHVAVTGVHCHIGSQIFDVAPFELAAEKLLYFLDDLRKETDLVVKELDLGGGFGIFYTKGDSPLPYDSYLEKVSKVVHKTCEALSYPLPFVVIEPGRSVVGGAGITLYTVGAVKEIPGVRTYVSIDGGMTDNPRYPLYQSHYEMVSAENAGQAKTKTVTLAGKCCESGDLIGENMPTQEVHRGDIVAVLSTGAYNYSMASNYNRIPRPPLVIVREGESRLAVKRESFEDLLRNDL